MTDGYVWKSSGITIPIRYRDGKPLCPCALCLTEPMVENGDGTWSCQYAKEATDALIAELRRLLAGAERA